MIPLLEAINNESWLKSENVNYVINGITVNFQVKPLSIRKIDILNEVDEPLKLGRYDKDISPSSNIWLLNCEVVNLCKEAFLASGFVASLVLTDSEGYHFNYTNDPHLTSGSQFAEKMGLSQFGGQLRPKIKRQGSIAFVLPDYILDEDQLFIWVCEGGKLIEI